MDIIEIFQQQMKKNNITAYIVPTSDFHNSEYVSDYFKARAYLTGFTGSAGVLLITLNKGYLWTDGRYFIQAEKQIENRPIELMRMGQPDVPTLVQFLKTNLKENDTLAFDGRVLTTSFVLKLKESLPSSINFITNIDLVNSVWAERPKLPFSILYKLDDFYTGMSFKDKLAIIRQKMQEENANTYIISALEDQAWLYNLRANDVKHTPVFLAYSIITETEITLFIDQNKIDIEISKYLEENNVKVKNYFDIYDVIKGIKKKTVMIDSNKVNYQIYQGINQNNTIIFKQDPTLLLKSIKNKTEINNTKIAHIKDGVCVTKLMKYVKTNYKNNIPMTEISVSDYIKNLREKTEGFIDLSFDSICAFNDHGAMMHYSATPETNATIDKPGLLLLDSGAHYLEGTTDITRTFALGKISDKMKVHFTMVLKSVIALSRAVFLKGCNGQNLDILARGPIWRDLLDYKCGTGHGVGNLLSVHEAPNGFRWQIVPERSDSAPFQTGMITTNEPGIYLKGNYGIRTENEMLCVDAGQSEFGEFLKFETITFAPIDLDAIKNSLLNKEEKEWLNNYHKQVYDKISPYLNDEEKEWLQTYTKEIK